MWSGKDQAAFLALVLMVVGAHSTTAETCSPQRVHDSNFDTASGVWFLIFSGSGDERFVQSGLAVLSYYIGDRHLAAMTWFYSKRTTRGCELVTTRCEVIGKSCVYVTEGNQEVGKYYIIAQDKDYLVVYRTLSGHLHGLYIYSRTGVGQPFRNLPLGIRDAIGLTCGESYAETDTFWPGKYSPGNFSVNCKRGARK